MSSLFLIGLLCFLLLHFTCISPFNHQERGKKSSCCVTQDFGVAFLPTFVDSSFVQVQFAYHKIEKVKNI